MEAGYIARQDPGQPIDLLHHPIDLSVPRAADRHVGQRLGEKMPGRAQGLEQLADQSTI
jgi:hypothetical protein